MPAKAACQLLTAIDDGEEAAAVLLDPNYAVQQKFDGKRIILDIGRDSITPHNREGLTCSISPEIIKEAKAFSLLAPITLDGEWIREIKSFQTFDVLQLGGTDTKPLPFKTRQVHLQQVFKTIKARSLQLARTEYEQARKVSLLQRIHDAQLEGIVLKHIDSPYKTDRQKTELKYKFTAVSSFLVTKLHSPKQSVAIAVFDANGNLVPSGDVKIRNSRFKLAEGMVIDVRYSHAFPQSHLVFQPRMISIRDDLQPEACVISQLRYKGTKTAIIL